MGIWTTIVAFLPFLQQILNWWNGIEAAQTGANTAEQNAEAAHQNDGGQSVSDKISTDAQHTALDQIAKQIDNPTPIVVVTPPKGS